ncbi:VWA domain-containing protein [Oceaniglobus indicus]|uniref:VWA domain-containing protein n=1 Tax=Oceaniglobus indicus TaxID=2047749 RepID=UPI000C185C5F|nr:VWA domain-containing protein [Oceaniglobus indicus]
MQDEWIITDDNGGGDPVVTHVVQSGRANALSAASFNFDDVSYGYDFDLAPGETQIFMHFLTQNNTMAEAEAEADILKNLGDGATDGMSPDELRLVVNFDTGFVDDPVYGVELNGTARRDILDGGDYADTITGFGGDDLISGNGGDDLIFGRNGADVLMGDDGADLLVGAQGHDLLLGGNGDDILSGDNNTSLVTTTNTRVAQSTGQEFSVSLTVPDAANGTTLPLQGYVSRTPVTSEILNIALVIDTSGSTSGTFQGTRQVADQNGDGVANTILDAEIAGLVQLINAINRKLGSDANISLTRFDSSGQEIFRGIANADNNGNGTPDVIDALRGLRANGGTSFESGLNPVIDFFEDQDQGQNVLYFMSDGENGGGSTSFADEVTTLLDTNGINATIRSFGVGADASEEQLDLLDDGIDNNSTTIILDPSTLGGELVDSGITRADIERVLILVNGQVARNIPAADLIQTPLGFRFEFGGTLNGLNATEDDRITVRAIATDPGRTIVNTFQIVEHEANAVGYDTLIGGDGNDVMDGGAWADVLFGGNGDDRMDGGNGLDRLFGGNGTDIMSGGGGNDTLKGGAGADQMFGNRGSDLYFVDNEGDVVREFRNEGRDTVRSSVDFQLGANIENLSLIGVDRIDGTGNALANIMVGNAVSNTLRGFNGQDKLLGRGGSDILDGGRGDDTLTGGGGADQFVFRSGDGNDVVRDFRGANREGDVIDLRGVNAIANFNDLLNNHLTQVGSDVVIDQMNGNTITLENVNRISLVEDDFIF